MKAFVQAVGNKFEQPQGNMDFEPLPTRIFELLLKNVSPDEPLFEDELEVKGILLIKSHNSTISSSSLRN